MPSNNRLIIKVAEIYDWLNLQIAEYADLAGSCDVCGRCCEFENFDHRLFVTPPEVMYLAANLDSEGINPPHRWRIKPPNKRRIKPMLTSNGSTSSTPLTTYSLTTGGSTPLTTSCPYNIEGKCSIYKYRFAGCRIFCCRGDKNFQSRLSESALKKFKSICTELHIPYRYTDLATALNL